MVTIIMLTIKSLTKNPQTLNKKVIYNNPFSLSCILHSIPNLINNINNNNINKIEDNTKVTTIMETKKDNSTVILIIKPRIQTIT